jgi:hypothetical protein
MNADKKREIALFENTLGLFAMTPSISVIAVVSKQSQELCTLLNELFSKR